MTLPDNRTLKQRAAAVLAPHVQQAKKLIVLHAGAVALLNFLVLLLTVLLNHGIESTGGLSGLQTRAMLTTAQFTLQMALMIAAPFWQMSWVYMILKFSRGGCAESADLLTGFRKFGPVLRLMMLKGLIFTGLIFAGMYAGYFIFLSTPLAKPLLDVAQSTTDPEAIYEAVMQAMTQIEIPLILICGVFALAFCVPFYYRFRQAEYFLLDHTELGARTALRASRRLMRGNAWRMAKLDLSFWWFWLLNLLVSAVAYADTLLPMAGIRLPVSKDIAFLVAFALSVPLQLLLYRNCKVNVDAAYATAYEMLSPPAQPETSISFPVSPE